MSKEIIRLDPNDPRRYIVHNEQNGYVDNGKLTSERPHDCHNCGSKESIMTTISLHFCKCGALFNYWGGGGNDKWRVHEKRLADKQREIEEYQQWLDDVDDYNNGY